MAHPARVGVGSLRTPPWRTVRSVDRALAILTVMAGGGRGAARALFELRRVSGLAKSTTHRLLMTLIARGFVEPATRTGQYRLGIQASVVGAVSTRSRQ